MADAPQTESVQGSSSPQEVVATPVVETSAAAASAAPEPKVEVAPVEPAPEAKAEPHPADVPTLLEEAGKKPEEKAAAEAKPGDKPAEPEQPAAPEPAKIEWEFQLPETLKADDAALGRFKDTLGALIAPKEGETPSHAAQRLIDMHNEALVTHDKQLRDNQVKVWNDTRAEWRKQAMADPEIGGAGYNTAMVAVARVRDALVSDAKFGSKRYEQDARELNDFMRITGAGDHPVFLKLLHRAACYIDEPSMPSVKASPPPDLGKKPGRNLYAD